MPSPHLFDMSHITLIISDAYRTGWEVLLSDAPEKLVFTSARHRQQMWVFPASAERWHVRVVFPDSAFAREISGSEEIFTVTEDELCKLFIRASDMGRAARLRGENPAYEPPGIPQNTEAERTVMGRIGQDMFRASLMNYWGGACSVTGINLNEILRASHIKPWADCTDMERLDVYNGLLLTANLDALFDSGLISFSDSGDVIISERLPTRLIDSLLPQGDKASLRKIEDGHRKYLQWHRARVFCGSTCR